MATKGGGGGDGAYVPLYQRFLVREKRFTQQFSHLYTKRVAVQSDAVRTAAALSWKMDVGSLFGKAIDAGVGDTVAVVGTLYKEMKLKPNVLSEFAKQDAPVSRANYCSEDDTLLLEDESGRVTLGGLSGVDRLVTGVVVCVRGKVDEKGVLMVEALQTCGVPSPKPLPTRPTTGPKYVVLVSGLGLGSPTFDPVPLTLLSEFVTTSLEGGGGGGGDDDAGDLAAGIARVVVCGGVVHPPEDELAMGMHTITAVRQEAVAAPIAEGDAILSAIAGDVPLDVMPGAADASNFNLPQQPLHRCLFPLASRRSNFRPVTNPYDAEISGVRFLGASGQPVDDLVKYSSMTPMEALTSSLTWGHMAPTAPDTLACYPFYEMDPFVIEDGPHVYFSGNHPTFETCEVPGKAGPPVRVIAVPSFAETGTAVLLDLTTLDAKPLCFKSDL